MIKKFDQFIKESYNSLVLIKSRTNYNLINESQESKSQSEAKKYIRNNNKFNWNETEIDNFVRIKLRNDITSLRDKQIGKFTLGVTRMYFNNEISDASTINDLNTTLKLLSAHLNEYDRNLNGLSAEELISKFKQTRENNVKKEKQEINRMKFGVSDYEIVKIDSFNDAKKYYKYTNPNSRWCLTHMEDMYDSYTCDGMNQIYFCLKNGFENIKPVIGENAPLDEYGLSMLSIIVNEYGELAYCTCRWNHDNGGNDSIMNAVEISEIVNVNFYETFKPNSKWKDMINDVKHRLNNGENLKEIFDKIWDFKDGFTRIKLNKKYNFINKENEFLSDKWFDDAMDFKDGFARVNIKNKGYNFINKENEFLSDDWFEAAGDFKDGFATVYIKNKGYNFINKENEFLSDKWFDDVWSFNEGFALVEIKNKGWNFINKENEFLSDKWFEAAWDFDDGFAKVKIKNKGYNFINKDGKYLLDDWFDEINDFNRYGHAIVKDNNKGYNFINKDGKYLSDDWFDVAWVFDDGFAKVKIENKGYNFTNTDGKYISNDWFDDAWTFNEGFVMVEIENKGCNFINKDGKYLSDDWFDVAWVFNEGFARVKIENKGYNFINTDGKYLSDDWFDDVDDFNRYGHAIVKNNNKRWNFINTEGKIISDEWFDTKTIANNWYVSHML